MGLFVWIHTHSRKSSVVGYAESREETRLWDASILTVWSYCTYAKVPRKLLSDEAGKIFGSPNVGSEDRNDFKNDLSAMGRGASVVSRMAATCSIQQWLFCICQLR